MDAPNRGALMLVRFVATCGIGMSLVEIALAEVQFKYRGIPVNFLSVAFWIVVALAGIVVLIKAVAVADWISEKLDL
jgi:Ni/Fe-hydrogenase subunit HybB-like protein